jgi:hypothetical protein
VPEGIFDEVVVAATKKEDWTEVEADRTFSSVSCALDGAFIIKVVRI